MKAIVPALFPIDVLHGRLVLTGGGQQEGDWLLVAQAYTLDGRRLPPKYLSWPEHSPRLRAAVQPLPAKGQDGLWSHKITLNTNGKVDLLVLEIIDWRTTSDPASLLRVRRFEWLAESKRLALNAWGAIPEDGWA